MDLTLDQGILFSLIILIFGFLLWGRFRYDLVAFAALVVAYLLGVIPKNEVFAGFGHPAVVIIALVLIISRGLNGSGAIELLAKKLIDSTRSIGAHIGIMSGVAAVLSAIMNNVAALALLMPMDIQTAAKAKRSPALTLMPLSFASILGGMITLIGTPPNVVIATFREDALGEPYGMFDFAPVGLIVAFVGVLFVALVGWRLIPVKTGKGSLSTQLEGLEGYLSELCVPEGSKFVGEKVKDLDLVANELEVQVLGLIRDGHRLPGRSRSEIVITNDILVVEGGAETIDQFLGEGSLTYNHSKKHEEVAAEGTALIEVAVPQNSRIAGRSAMDVKLLQRQGVILLGISRSGRQIRERLRKERILPGDLLLLQGPEDRLSDAVNWLECLPLADRGLEIIQRSKAWISVGVFAVAILCSAMGWIYLPLALAAVVIVFISIKIVPLSQVYRSIEWSVIVLLAAMIPIGAALESSGGTDIIANQIVNWTSGMPTVFVLAVLMIVTMSLSDVLNNVATALIAAPIGVEIANRLEANPDSFLMAVAVAASCAFLTPIGHKNNTIIMGPGGYKFGDYWRMGLPLEIIVVLVGLPAILFFWPL
ncbi:MAG: di/tricarboxylate transporter [Candidatus Pelagisphaera sp.]|jgi:di/tricarboxylate transporter